MRKIKSKEEANRIIREIEALLNKGYELTDQQVCSYKFAEIFLREIAKRRKKFQEVVA